MNRVTLKQCGFLLRVNWTIEKAGLMIWKRTTRVSGKEGKAQSHKCTFEGRDIAFDQMASQGLPATTLSAVHSRRSSCPSLFTIMCYFCVCYFSGWAPRELAAATFLYTRSTMYLNRVPQQPPARRTSSPTAP